MGKVFVATSEGGQVLSPSGLRVYWRAFPSSLRVAVQNKLIELAQAAKFPEIKYDKTDGTVFEPDFDDAGIVPSSIKCNEVGSNFEADRKYGRERRRKRENWFFDLLLEFNNTEVSLELFEQSLVESMPYLRREETEEQNSATILLLNTSVDHPVTQQGTTGTHAKLSFSVELGRN